MHSPLVVVLEEDASVREEARSALTRAGIESVAAATPADAANAMQSYPWAVVATSPPKPELAAWAAQLATVCRLASAGGTAGTAPEVQGASAASHELRDRLRELASSHRAVVFVGETGSGRAHAAQSLHALSSESGPFVTVPADDPKALADAMHQGRGTAFMPSIERAAWSVQDQIAQSLSSQTKGTRFMASTTVDPDDDAGRSVLSPALIAALREGVVRVPPLRERSEDIPPLVRAFVEDLRRLNGLPPISVAEDAMAALSAHPWPGNLRQLRGAVETAVMVASGGIVRAEDLPDDVRGLKRGGGADRRFREAKRTVVDAFERAYLEDLLRRNGGNVTSAAEQAGMLRSALQRLLRKHDLHSADFRRRAGAERFLS